MSPAGGPSPISPEALEKLKTENQLLKDRKAELEKGILADEKFAQGGDVAAASLERTSAAYDKASLSSQQFNDFLGAIGNSDSIPQLERALAVTNQRLAESKTTLEATGLPVGNLAELQERLLTATGSQRTALLALIGLYKQQAELQKNLATARTANDQKAIAAAEAAIARENALRGEAYQRQLNQVNQLLKNDKLTEDQRTALLERRNGLVNNNFKRSVDAAQDALNQTTQAGEQTITQLQNSGTATAREISAAYRDSISSVEAFAAANQVLINKSPELKAAIKDALSGLANSKAQSDLNIPKEALEAAITAARGFGTEAVTSEEKLAAVRQGLAVLENASIKGLITTLAGKNKLHEETNKFRREEVKLTAEVAKIEAAQVRETQGVRRENLAQNIELLKQEQALTGKDNSRLIRAQEQQALAERIQAVREQQQQEVEQAGNTESAKIEAAKRASLRIQAIKTDEVLKRIRAEQDVTKSADEESKKQQDIANRLAGLKANRLGGPDSPIQSLEELSLESASRFSISSSFGKKPTGLLQFQRQVDDDVSAGDRLRSGNKPNFSQDNVQYGPPTSESGGVTNVYLSLPGETIEPKNPKVRDAVRTIVDEYRGETKQRGSASGM